MQHSIRAINLKIGRAEYHTSWLLTQKIKLFKVWDDHGLKVLTHVWIINLPCESEVSAMGAKPYINTPRTR